jgi:hypothetical protein
MVELDNAKIWCEMQRSSSLDGRALEAKKWVPLFLSTLSCGQGL